MSREELSSKLNHCYDRLIYIIYYTERKGYQASKERKRSNISSHLFGIYQLCVNNWNLVLTLPRDDLYIVLNSFKLIKSENLFLIPSSEYEKFKELEKSYVNFVI